MKTLKYSRQRESIKAYLAARHDHPTADTLYTEIRKEYPNISLGTVYRNLNLLVELGEIQKITCGDGKDHFDAQTYPHYHFVCRRCGSVFDVPMKTISDMEKEAARQTGARVDSHTIHFYGECANCLRSLIIHNELIVDL